MGTRASFTSPTMPNKKGLRKSTGANTTKQSLSELGFVQGLKHSQEERKSNLNLFGNSEKAKAKRKSEHISERKSERKSEQKRKSTKLSEITLFEEEWKDDSIDGEPVQIFSAETPRAKNYHLTKEKSKLFVLNHEADPWRPIVDLIWKCKFVIEDLVILVVDLLSLILPDSFPPTSSLLSSSTSSECPSPCDFYEAVSAEHHNSFLSSGKRAPRQEDSEDAGAGFVQERRSSARRSSAFNSTFHEDCILISEKQFLENQRSLQTQEEERDDKKEIDSPNWPPRFSRIKKAKEAEASAAKKRMSRKQTLLRRYLDE